MASAASSSVAAAAASASASSSSKCAPWTPAEGGEILGDWTPKYMDIFKDILVDESVYEQVIEMMGCITGCFRRAKRQRISENFEEAPPPPPKKLGEGGFGSVYDTQDGNVIKIIKDPTFPKREATFLYSLQSNVFPKFVGAFSGSIGKERYDLIVMERVLGGVSLQSFLVPENETAPPTPFENLSKEAKENFLNQLRTRLIDLISKLHNIDRLAHLDIKPANFVVVVDDDGNIERLNAVDGGSLAPFDSELSPKLSPGTGGYCATIDQRERTSWRGWIPIIRPASPFAQRFVEEKLTKTSNGKSFIVTPDMNAYAFYGIDHLMNQLKVHFGIPIDQSKKWYLGRDPKWSAQMFPKFPMPKSPFLPKLSRVNESTASAAPAEAQHIPSASRGARPRASTASASAAATATAVRKQSASRRARSRTSTVAPVSASAEAASASAEAASAAPVAASAEAASASAAPIAPIAGSKRSRRGGRRTRRKRRSRTRKVR